MGHIFGLLKFQIIFGVLEISKNCDMCDQQSLRPTCAYAQSDRSLSWSLEYSMTRTLLTDYHLEFLNLSKC